MLGSWKAAQRWLPRSESTANGFRGVCGLGKGCLAAGRLLRSLVEGGCLTRKRVDLVAPRGPVERRWLLTASWSFSILSDALANKFDSKVCQFFKAEPSLWNESKVTHCLSIV